VDAVLNPADLYQVAADAPEPEEPVLVVALEGFVDAGAAARLAVAALREGRESRPVVRFDVDQLIDYRSRRPPLRFETDHWGAYSAPELAVVETTDTAGTPYLLLSGPEPDTQWERFAAAVAEIVERFGVRLVVSMTGIPMAVPHTRPIGVTAHGTKPELTEGHEAWFATAEVPGSAVALTEFRLGEADRSAMGFAVHVPHYLARSEYPQAARVLLDHVGLAGGLYLPTESLLKAAERAEAEIAEQVANSEEVAQVVHALERQYDTVAAGRGERSAQVLGGQVPSADEIAAEVERFLAGHDGGDGDDGDGGDGDGREDGGGHERGGDERGGGGDEPER
jgi:proteasome assembly chaperone (PAC2) family protein